MRPRVKRPLTSHKDCKDEQAAYDMIDAWIAPESGAWLIDNYGYGSTNSKAYDLVAADRPRLSMARRPAAKRRRRRGPF